HSSAVLFLEWIYETGQLVGSITDKATSWWNNNLELAKEAYYKFQNESPLKRLSTVVGNDDAVDGEKWARLEKRVMALLLASMSSSVKAEITMLRIDRVKHCLFKLYTIYAPGGASERASLIKQLEYIQPQNNIIDMIAALRRWKKLIGRAAEMGVQPSSPKDVNFKLNMAKSELSLPYKPALSSVLTYADHVIVELQQVIPYGKDQGAKLKGVTTDHNAPSSATTSPTGKGQKQQSPCKFWATDEGCRRGSNCKYAHNFASKEDKKARCWTYGSINHRQQDCPTKSGKKGLEEKWCDDVIYYRGTYIHAACEIRELAEQFLAKIKRLAPLQAVTDNAVVDLELLLRSQGLGESHGMALLVSGASHAYRAPKTLEEAKEAKQVKVQLADGRHVFLRQTKGGTLLAEDDSGGTILPLGSLVSSLGCKLDWSKRKGLRITHPEHGLLPTKLVGNTPVLRETEALQLIADLEQLELDKLEKNNTDGVLKMMSAEESQLAWLDHLEEFVQKGERASLRRMLLDEESPLDAVAETEVVSLIGVDDRLLLSDEAGDHSLKSLPINRAMRKRLLRTRWVVHLYNGDEKGEEFARAESEDVTVIRMDVRDSKAYDLKTYGPAARVLLWAAARGQIEGVIGGTHLAPFVDELCMDQVQGILYFMASSLGLSDGMDIEEAILNWRRSDLRRHEATLCKIVGPRELNAKDLAYWETHGRNNHIPYDRRCQTCVRGSATGRAHRRCLTPSAYTLSLDICGPMRTREESQEGRKFRYLLVGAYSHPKLDLPRDHKMPEVDEEDDVEPELDPFEEEDKIDAPPEEEDAEQKALNERFKRIYKDIGDDIECQTLNFAVPMTSRTSKEAKDTRSWMEALVREIKRRVKATKRLGLGNYEDKDLAFGAPTHVKYKRFGEGGRYDLLERWKEGLFVGYSNDVKGGRVVRHEDGSYTTSVHIKPYLVDSDDLVQLGPHEVELPLPERRTRGKTTLAKALVDPNNDIDNLAKSFLDNNQFQPEHVIELWKYLKAKARPTSRTTQGEGLQWLIGQSMRDCERHVPPPSGNYLLVRAFKEMTGRDDFTALLLTENVGMKCHRDVHNNATRSNWLLPLPQCEEGGGVWMESSPEAYSCDDEWRELPKGGWKRGRVHELQPGVPLEINPRRYHATEPWTATRLVITAYTPRTTSMKPDTYETLREFGFNPPPLPPRVPDQLQQTVLKMVTMTKTNDEPEAVMFLVNEIEEEKRERARDVSRELQQLQDDVLNRLKERREWLREFLAEEEILAEELHIVGEAVNEEIEGVNGAVRDLIKDVEEQIQKTEEKCHDLYLKVANVNDDKEIGDIEEYLANLKKDLDVTLDVPLDQVKRNLDKWVDPLRKELANLEEKTDASPHRGSRGARARGAAATKEQPPRWKRKARVVICGNHAGQWHDPNDLFAAGASVEGAMANEQVVFIVKRALYGLRESPALWAAHRTEVLKELSVDSEKGRIYLKQMMTDSELWMILEEPKDGGQPSLKGILVTYVDDLLYLADTPVIELLHGRIGAIWPCSPLEYAKDGLRYLGMELKQEKDFFTLSQEAYMANLVRLHGLDVDVSAGLPCPKEWIQEDDQAAEEENYSSSELMMAQKVTGECLWMAYRTRPDILYATNDMAAMTTKRPVKVYQIGLKVMSYLNATAGLKLKARLLHLLGTWGMIGLEGLDEKKVLQCMKLGCMFLLLLAVQSLAVSAAKEPLPAVGTMELFVLLILTCISAVALWEAGKALGSWAYPRLFGSKRERKIRKLKELARIAAEAEIEKWVDEDGNYDGDYSYDRIYEAEDHYPVAQSYNRVEPEEPDNNDQAGYTTVAGEGTICAPSPSSGQFDRERVVQDALGLMTVQHLRDGLASEGLPVSGVKSDLTRRLGGQLGVEPPAAHLPTTRQLRYVLWTWRHFQLAGGTQILWVNLATRTAVSEWLARWNRN
ncbi:GIP, partial [Symbiodinium necroappetens]